MDQMTREAHGQAAEPQAGHKLSEAHGNTTVTPDIPSLWPFAWVTNVEPSPPFTVGA